MAFRVREEMPNARGKPHRSAQHGGNQQAKLVGVGLTKQLGWWQTRRCLKYSLLLSDLFKQIGGACRRNTIPLCDVFYGGAHAHHL